MIGILINHDVIAVPQPSIAEGDVGCCHIPEPAVEPEPARTSPGKVPDVAMANAARKVPMRPGLVQVIAVIVFAAIVPTPILAIHVRNVRMAGLVAIV